MGALKIGAGIIIGFFGIVFILAMIVGMSTSGHNYQVQVISNDSYTGAVGINGTITSYDGDSDMTIDAKDASFVSATFTHMSGDGTLTVNILDNGKVVKTGTTSAEYGCVSISI